MQLTIQREYITRIDSKEALRKIFIVLFNQENRLRALEGKPPITREQFKTAIVNL